MHRFVVLMVLATGCVSSNRETLLDAGSGGTGPGSCDEMRQAAQNAFYKLMDTSRICTADSDCVVSGSIQFSCLEWCPSAMNKGALADAGTYADEVCGPFLAQGCGPTPGWHGCLGCPGPICDVDAGSCECDYGR
jgi:hypothetical protein